MKSFKFSLSDGQYCKILVLTTVIFSSGCAHSPLLQEWDFSVRPDRAQMKKESDEQHNRLKERLAGVYKEHPKWRNTVVDDTFFVEYFDQNGVPTGSATIK